VLTAAIGVDACFETNVRAVVSRDDGLGGVAKKLRLPARAIIRGKIDINSLRLVNIDVKFFESVSGTP